MCYVCRESSTIGVAYYLTYYYRGSQQHCEVVSGPPLLQTVSVGWFLLVHMGQEDQSYFSNPLCP